MPTAILLLATIAAQTNDARLLVDACLDARKRLDSGKLEFSLHAHVERKTGADDYRHEFWTVWDHGRRRVVYKKSGPALIWDRIPEGMPKRPDIRDPAVAAKLREVGALIDKDNVRNLLILPNVAYSHDRGAPLMYRYDDGKIRDAALAILDPMVLGISIDGPEDIDDPEAILAPAQTEWSEQPADDASPGTRIVEGRRMVRNTPVTDRLWIDTTRDFSIIRREYGIADKPPISTMTVELKQWPGGRWFPSRVQRASLLGGKPQSSSVIEVRSAEFNAAVADEEFSVAKLEVSPGQVVYDPVAGKELGVWNGRETVAAVAASAPAQVAAAPPQLPVKTEASPPLWPWVVSGAAAAAAIALFLWRRAGH